MLEDFVKEFVEIKVIFEYIFGTKDWKDRLKRGVNSPGELKLEILIYV